MRPGKTVLNLLVLLAWLIGTPTIYATDMYEFHIDSDRLTGAPAVHLNRPITLSDAVRTHKGHFYTVGEDLEIGTVDDERVKFWGINLSPPLVFPVDMREARRLAMRLSKLGFNLVRIHGLDHQSDESYKSIFSVEHNRGFPNLSQVNLSALDRLFDAFKDHGIYVDLVLKSGYIFDAKNDCYYEKPGVKKCIPDPGTVTQRYPDTVDIGSGSQPLDLFNHEMIELQKIYFMQLLSRYKDHPALALVEINNENSLIEHMLVKNGRLPSLYAEELDRLWDAWLVKKYSNTSTLRAAWRQSTDKKKTEMIRNGDFSSQQKRQPKHWQLEQWKLNGFNDWGSWHVTNGGELEVLVKDIPEKYWYFFFGQRGVSIEEGQAYRVQFSARADDFRKIRIVVQGMSHNAESAMLKPYEVVVSNVMDDYTFCFISNLSDSDARLTFLPIVPGSVEGALWVDNISVVHADGQGLNDWEMLSSDHPDGDVSIGRSDAISSSGCPRGQAALHDYYNFIASVERNYYQEMVAYIKDDIGFPGSVTGTQANYGGLLSHKNMADLMDYIDIHHYWDHPRIPKNDQINWSMRNESMIRDPLKSIVARIAEARVAGKPFTISEYSPNQLNQYAHEGHVLAAAYAALQDIDGVFLFTYFDSGGDTRERLNPKQQLHWYNILGDTRAEALMHVASYMFRRGDVHPIKRVVQLNITDKNRIDQLKYKNGIRNIASFISDCNHFRDKDNGCVNLLRALSARLELFHDDSADIESVTRLMQNNKEEYVNLPNEFVWVSNGINSHVIIDTPRTKVLTGNIKGPVQLSEVTVNPLGNNINNVTISVTANDGLPIKSSSSLLATIVGRGANKYLQYMPSNSGYILCVTSNDGKCIAPFWHPTSGPFQLEENYAVIQINTSADNMSVLRLNQIGVPESSVVVNKTPSGFEFTAGETPWYQIILSNP